MYLIMPLPNSRLEGGGPLLTVICLQYTGIMPWNSKLDLC